MTINLLKPFLFFIPLIIVQLVIVPLISIFSAVPNLILILIVYFTLLNGQLYGTILGFVFGLFSDLFSGGLIGAYMFSFTLSAFIAGYFFNENKIEKNTKTYFFLFILLVAAVINSFINSTVSNSNNEITFSFLFFEGALLPGIYTALFGLPLVVFETRKGF